MSRKSRIERVGAVLFGKRKSEKVRQFARSRRVLGDIGRGHTGEFGFLHIPKTGGSAFSGFSREMLAAGYAMPVKFGHVWTLSDIVQSFPATRVSFMIRDPLERTISAFNSRLRQGRPRFNNSWSQKEAIAFSLFCDVDAFLSAVISGDEHDISAVRFTHESIKHLRWDFQNYFESVKNIERHRSSIFLVGEVENSQMFWEKLAALADVPPEVVAKNFKRKHVAKISSHDVLARFSDTQIEAMKVALKKEYKIYNALKAMVNC